MTRAPSSMDTSELVVESVWNKHDEVMAAAQKDLDALIESSKQQQQKATDEKKQQELQKYKNMKIKNDL